MPGSDGETKKDDPFKKLTRPHNPSLDCRLELPTSTTNTEDNGGFTPSPDLSAYGVTKSVGSSYGWRHFQFFLLFCVGVVYMFHRASMSVAIVGMTTEITPDQEVFHWSHEQQGTVLGAFLWGYAATQLPSGYLATRFGAKLLMGLSLVSSAVLTMCIPVVSRQWGCVGLVFLRVCSGLVQGIAFPGIFTLLGKWTVPSERSVASACTFTAQPLGNFLALALSGIIAESLGWQLIFPILSGVTLIITVMWFVFAADSPEEDRYISDAERSYICQAIGKESRIPTGPIPWGSILTSLPLISVILANTGFAWCLWFSLAAFPSYMKDIFKFSISQSGVVSGAPFFFTALIAPVLGVLSRIMIREKWSTTTFSRKIMNTIGFWGQTILFISVSMTPNECKVIQIVELTLAVGLSGAVYSGSMVGFVDLSPRYSGLLFSISNCISSVTSALAPLITGAFVDRLGEDAGWSASFYLAAAIAFFTNLFYIIFGTADQQPWNDDVVKQNEPDKTHDSIEIGCENPVYKHD